MRENVIPTVCPFLKAQSQQPNTGEKSIDFISVNIQSIRREKSQKRHADYPNLSILSFIMYLELGFLSLNGLNSP